MSLSKAQKWLRYRRNCQNFTWNRGKFAKNWQCVKIAGNFAKIACDFCKNLIASLPSKIAELAINRGVWQHCLLLFVTFLNYYWVLNRTESPSYRIGSSAAKFSVFCWHQIKIKIKISKQMPKLGSLQRKHERNIWRPGKYRNNTVL